MMLASKAHRSLSGEPCGRARGVMTRTAGSVQGALRRWRGATSFGVVSYLAFGERNHVVGAGPICPGCDIPGVAFAGAGFGPDLHLVLGVRL